jgi:hypothetical protein
MLAKPYFKLKALHFTKSGPGGVAPTGGILWSREKPIHGLFEAMEIDKLTGAE